MSHRPGLSGTLLTLGIATAASLGAIGATLLVPSEPPAALQSASALTEVATHKQDFLDQRTVEVTLSVTPPTPLAATTSGVVSALRTDVGQQVTSGSSPLDVSGTPVLALHTRVPLYRDLVSGTKGDDVRALQEELLRLGYKVTPDGQYGWDTSEAVRLLKKSIGTSDPDRTLALTQVLWLPATSVTPSQWAATLGSPVAAGSPYGVIPGALTAVSVAAPPSSLAPGAREITLWGHTAALDDQFMTKDPAFLETVKASADYAAALTSEDAQKPTATLTLAEPLPAMKVPPTALFATDGASACIQSADSAIPVTVVGSALGSSLITVDGEAADAPKSVRIGQGITQTSCR